MYMLCGLTKSSLSKNSMTMEGGHSLNLWSSPYSFISRNIRVWSHIGETVSFTMRVRALMLANATTAYGSAGLCAHTRTLTLLRWSLCCHGLSAPFFNLFLTIAKELANYMLNLFPNPESFNATWCKFLSRHQSAET